MKKIVFRVLSFSLDTFLIMAITTLLAVIPFINPGYNEYKREEAVLNEIKESYYNFATEYNNSIEDGKITSEEIKVLEEKSDEYASLLEDKVDKDLSDDDKKEVSTKVQELYVNKYNDTAYDMTHNNSVTTIIYILVTILYLGIVQYLLNGKTLGKYIFRLRVVNSNDSNKKIPLYVYIVRAILIGEVLIQAADLIALYSTNKDSYLQTSNIISSVKYIYEVAFLIVMMMREDGRSIHDLLLNTRVALFDKSGKEVVEVEEPVEEVKEETKKEDKKKTTKKTTTKKKTTKKKEFVSAEKVDD